MGFGNAIRSGFQNYTNFRDRSSRSEYWYWLLFTFVGGIITTIIDVMFFDSGGFGVFNPILNLALLLPSFAVGVRRLHDIDRTGWWLLIGMTGIGLIILIIWFCQKSDPIPNRFGEPPIPLGLA